MRNHHVWPGANRSFMDVIMRKADYTVLSIAINIRLRDARALSVLNPEEKRYYDGATNALINTANDFARNANVNRTEFLKACGIED